MKLGCHAVLFRELIKNDTDRVLGGLASSGYRGVEIGSRFFGISDRERLEASLDAYGMVLSGMHVGVTPAEWTGGFEAARERVLGVARFVAAMPNKNVILSGARLEGDVDLEKVAKRMDEVAAACAGMGVRLCYHNHWWEFEDDQRIFRTLFEGAPRLQFALDVGWLFAGGYDPKTFVTDRAGRIPYVHVRDAKPDRKSFAELGEGVIDIPDLMSTLERILPANGWVVTEYEEGEQDFSRYRKAYEYLSRLSRG